MVDTNSVKISLQPTPKYPNSVISIFSVPTAGKNYLKLDIPPPLADNQIYQLWSLKGTDNPIPLDLFEGDNSKIIEVAFVANTDAYAITIEPAGGSQVPTMENLVGVFTM